MHTEKDTINFRGSLKNLESQLDEGTTVTVVLPTNLPADQDGMV